MEGEVAEEKTNSRNSLIIDRINEIT